MDETEERPVDVVVACSWPGQHGGGVQVTELTDAEWAAHRERSAAVVAEQTAAAEAEATRRAEITKQVDAHPDDLVRLLAREAGYGS